VVKGHPSVVFFHVTKFGAHVSALNSAPPFVGFLFSDLDEEGLDPVVVHAPIAFDHESRHDQGVIRHATHVSRPPLCRGNRRRMDYKFVSGLVESGGGLQRTDVRAVTDFRLGIAA